MSRVRWYRPETLNLTDDHELTARLVVLRNVLSRAVILPVLRTTVRFHDLLSHAIPAVRVPTRRLAGALSTRFRPLSLAR